MNLLDTASLVVTPNGYKASKLYSIIPSDGTGDMTFARTGDTATRVNSSGLIETVLANKPRLDYTSSTCPKLLLEPQRTNLLTYSDAFDNVSWTKTLTTVTADQIASPDGTTNADKLTQSSGTNASYNITTTASIAISSSTYTYSFFAKAGNYNYIMLACYGFAENKYYNIVVDLSNGTVTKEQAGTFASSYSYKIDNYGNGWYRIMASVYLSATLTAPIIYMVNSATPTILSYGQSSSTSAGGNFIYIYGVQLEAGSYATSYIPTTTASVTRNADNCSKTGISSLIGQTEGTVFVDVDIIGKTQSSINIFNTAKNTQSSFDIIHNSVNRIEFGVFNNGSDIILLQSLSAFALGGRAKIAFRYKSGSSTLYLNGVLQNSSSVSFTFIQSITDIFLGDVAGYFAYNENIKINSVALWKTGLQNSELATLTSL